MSVNTMAARVANFIGSLGVNTHIVYDNNPDQNTALVINSLNYIGIHNVRDNVPGANNVGLLEQVAGAGNKFELVSVPVGQEDVTQVIGNSISNIKNFEAATNALIGLEGPNEDNSPSWAISLNGGNSTDPAVAASVQRSIYQAYAADPALAGIPFWNMSVSEGINGWQNYIAGLGNLSDAAVGGNSHSYYNGQQPAQILASDIAYAQMPVPGKPIVVTESGYHTGTSGGSASEEGQAAGTLNMFADAFKDGVAHTYAYDLLNYTNDPTNPESNFGLFNTDGSPKLVATALHNLTTVLSDTAGDASTFAPGQINYGVSNLGSTGNSLLLEKASGVFDLMVWDEQPFGSGAISHTVSLGQTFANVSVYDPMVGTSAVQTLHNVSSLNLAVADHPMVVEVSGGSNPPPPPPPTDPTPITVGTGPDRLVFKISEDAYANGDGTSDAKGDAIFTVSVDGKQIGGTLTATASHALGQEQIVTANGSFGPGTHNVAVNFLNDAWDGKAGSTNDRNMYVDEIVYNGVNTNQSAVIYSPTATFFSPSATGFTVSGTSVAPPPPPPPPPPPTGPAPVAAGTGPDSLVLHVSGDAYANGDGTSDAAGDAAFTVKVDGKQVGGTFTALANHSLGQEQAFTLNGYFGAGSHDVSVTFLNDAWGGTAATDRNLYVDDVAYKGAITGQSAAFFGGGSKDFFVAGGTTKPSITVKSGSRPTLTVDGTVVHSETDYGATVKLTAPGVANVTLGATADTMRFIAMSKVSVVGGSASSSLTADGGANTFTPGKGAMTVTGGTGSDAFIYHSGSGNLTVSDFSLAKGDTLTIDKSMQAATKQASDGHGGTLLSFGSAAGKIDLLNMVSLPAGTLHYQ